MRSGDVVGGRFRVESLAGSGGMGTVWRAHDQETGRWVALKLLHGRDPRDTARFIREAQLIAALAHPGIVGHVADGQISETERYLVMEWLEGESLGERLEREPLTLAEALAMGRRASEALGAMHRHGVVHRDLKPSNLFLEGGDPERVKIIDFGIARRAGGPDVTRAGVLLGTPGFIAPEQALGDPNVDARADVFALGCVLFKCITGEGAYGTEDDLTILLRIVKGTARRARDVVRRLPAEIDDLLAAMLARDPADRPRDASVVASALARLADVYGPGHPGDDPLDELVTTRSQAIDHDLGLDEPILLGTTSPFPLTVPRMRGDEEAAPAAPPAHVTPMPAPAPAPDEGNDPAVVEHLEQVEGFLQRNDFRNALVHARRGVEAGARGQLYGALRTRQAEAHRWRGERFDAERAASEAMTVLSPGTELWWLAAREAVLGAGARSDAARVGQLAEDIMRLWPGVRVDASSVGTLVCTATFLVHAGHKELLGRFLGWAEPMLASVGREPPAIAARLHQLRVLRAIHEGDLGTNLQAAEAASERFTAAQDMRNSLIQRVNVAFVKVELGAYAHAEADLRAAITSAERMGLNNVALAARANLGIVLAKRGNHGEARVIMVDVLKESVSEGDRRFEASARTQLSLILLASGDVDGAVREAKGAVELTPPDAPSRVFALGAFARAQLAHDRPMAALEAAEQAMELLESLGGIEEGESLVRLVFAQAKRLTGDVEGAAAAISAARERLHARALLIKDLAFRQSFLRDVPDNAQTLRLCREWLDESREWSV